VNTPTVLRGGGLNFRPRTVELPDAPGPWRAAWSVKLAVMPGRSRLLDIEGGLALVNAPSGIVALGDGPPREERLLVGERIAARPGVEGGALLFDEAGNLYRWSPGEEPRKVWETDAPWNQFEAIALNGGLLLLQRPQSASTLVGGLRKLASKWVTELVEPDVGVRWQHSGDLRGVLPWEDALLVVPSARRTVLCLRVTDGAQRWKKPVGGRVSTLVAVVERKLWLTTYEGEVVAVDADTGDTEVRLRLPMVAVPAGVVDDLGRLHQCTGSSYTILDLAASGATVTSSPLPCDDDGPSLVFGSSAIPTVDGRLVFFDRKGRVFAARADDGSALTLLWRSPTPLLDCQAAKGMLFVLDREGALSALRP
jgi:PQQ-like domain